MGHRCANADWREHHDIVRKLKHHLGKALHRANNRFPYFTNRRYRDREEHAERHDLQNVAANHRFNDAGRKRVDDRFDQGLRMRLLDRFDNGCVCCIESHPDARFGEIHDRQADEQRGRGDDLEIDQRLNSHAPDLLQGTGTRDSDHDG